MAFFLYKSVAIGPIMYYVRIEGHSRVEPWGISGICLWWIKPFKYTPDEIRNSMFLPQMKKSLVGRRQNYSLFSYNKIFLLCRIVFRGSRIFSILPLMKIFMLPLKMESAPDEKYPGHASCVEGGVLWRNNLLYKLDIVTWRPSYNNWLWSVVIKLRIG